MAILGPEGGTDSGISEVSSDTTPQLGGDLDVNGNKIVSTSNGDIDIEPNGTGDVILGNYVFDVDQSVGAGQDDYVLTYDNAGGKISLEAATGGVSDHGALTGLSDDDHTQYALVAGTRNITGEQTFEAGVNLTTGNAYEINGADVLDATTLGSSVVNSSLTSFGTVTSGTLSTGAVLADVTMTLGSDADGDIYYRSSNKLTRLPKGTATQVLTMNGGATAPEWADAATGGDVTKVGTPVNNQVGVWTGDGTLEGPTNLTYDGTVLVSGYSSSSTARLGQTLETAVSANYGGASFNSFSTTVGHGCLIDMNKSQTNTIGNNGLVSDSTLLGGIIFRGNDGATFQSAAQILSYVDGTAASGDMPGRLGFYTSLDGTTSPVERMRITNNGAVGIGLTPYSYSKFNVYSDTGTTVTWAAYFENASALGAAQYGMFVSAGSGINDYVFRAMSRGAAADLFSIRGEGSVYMPQYADGTLSISSGLITSSSDESLKQEITPLYDSLDKLMLLTPVTFEWKHEAAALLAENKGQLPNKKIGFTAQGVEPHFPELVGQPTKEGGSKGLYYAEMVAVVVKAVQELNNKVDDINTRLQALEGK